MGPASLITSTVVSSMAAALFTRRSRSGFLGELDAVRSSALTGPEGEVADAMRAPRREDTSPLAVLEAPLPPASVIPPLTFAPGQDLGSPMARADRAAAPTATPPAGPPVHEAAPVHEAVADDVPRPGRPQEIWHPLAPVALEIAPLAEADEIADEQELATADRAGSCRRGDEPAPAPSASRFRLGRLRPFGQPGDEADGPADQAPVAPVGAGPARVAADPVEELLALFDRPPVELPEPATGSPWAPASGASVSPPAAAPVRRFEDLNAHPDDHHDGEPPWAELDRLAAEAPEPEPEPAEPPWAERDRTAPAVPLAYLEVDDALPPPWVAVPDAPEETRSEDVLVEELPSEEPPVEDAPVEEALVPEAPSEGFPAVDAPVEAVLVEEVLVPEAHVEEVLVEDAPTEPARPEPLPVAVDGTVAVRGGHLRLAPHQGHRPRRTAEGVVLEVATGWCWAALSADGEGVRLVLPAGTADLPAGTTALAVVEPDGSSFVVVVGGEAVLSHPGGRLRLRRGAMALVRLGGEPQVDVASVAELARDAVVAHNIALDDAR